MDFDWEIDCVPENLPKISDLVDPSIETGFLETVRLAALCEQEEKAVSLLRRSIDDLKQTRSKVDADKNQALSETLKLTPRLNAILAEQELVETQKENLKSLLKNLIADVDQLEQDKENKTGKLKRSFESYVKTLKIYENQLNIKVEALEGDIYTVLFSKMGERSTKLTLRSVNFKDWEVIDINPKKSSTVDQLTSYLCKTNDVIGLMCQARKNAEL